MINFFVVNHIGSDYNDEVYSLEEGGTPVRVFKTKPLADEFSRIANADEIATIAFRDWGYSLDDITDLSESEFNDAISEIVGQKFSDAFEQCDLQRFKLTREQKDKIAELLNLKFYVVEEVEGG